MTSPLNWRKSTYSGPGPGNQCVEVARDTTTAALRDSKNPTAGTLTLPATALAALLTHIKQG